MKQNSKEIKILVSGGGTGGHIFPAIAIANELKTMAPNCIIEFVGAKGRMEMEKVPLAGYSITGLWISGFQRSLSLKNLLFPLKLISSYFKARKIIKKFNPDLVIGTGGYASGPLLFSAAKKDIPSLIHEQNAFPGITNKLLGKYVTKVCVSYPNMEKYFPNEKIVITGNPIRKEILKIVPKRNEAVEFFNLDPTKKTVLIIGGSQGAQKINDAVLNNLSQILTSDIQIIWQTGISSFNYVNDKTSEFKSVSVHKFIERMDMAYSAADIIISRAGAIAIAEIIAAKKPAIYIPLPSAAEDHQTKNAMSLVDGNAGLLVSETHINEKLPVVLDNLIKDRKLQNKIVANLSKFSHPEAASKIADEALKLIAHD